MNADQFKGKLNQWKGDLKRKWGELTEDELMQAEGDCDTFMGRVQERYGNTKEDVIRWERAVFRSRLTLTRSALSRRSDPVEMTGRTMRGELTAGIF